jgi:hypothetical protein
MLEFPLAGIHFKAIAAASTGALRFRVYPQPKFHNPFAKNFPRGCVRPRIR